MGTQTTGREVRRVRWRLSAEVHKALKLAAIGDDTTMEGLAEQILVQYLRRRGCQEDRSSTANQPLKV